MATASSDQLPEITRPSWDSAEMERLRQTERFKWFARNLKLLSARYDLHMLRELLYGDPLWPAQREKALVMLSMRTDTEARAIIEGLGTPLDPKLQLFQQLALQAWQKRQTP